MYRRLLPQPATEIPGRAFEYICYRALNCVAPDGVLLAMIPSKPVTAYLKISRYFLTTIRA
jgi:hypothetical protein